MPSILNTKASVMQPDGSFKTQELPLPALSEGDALVKLVACGVCSGEAMTWYVSKKKNPVLGHEIVAEIVEVRGGHDYFKPGDRIFPHHHAPCGTCEYCKRDLESNCDVWKQSHLIPGGYADYFIVPKHNLNHDTVKIDSSIPLESAVLLEPLACCYRAVRKAGDLSRQRVLIVGLGVMGLLNVIAFRENTKTLVGLDFLEPRRNMGLQLGLSHALDPRKVDIISQLKQSWDGFLADVIIVCPPSAEVVGQSLDWINPGGKVILFAPPPPDSKASLSLNTLFFKEFSITSSYSAGPQDVKMALSALPGLSEKLQRLITHRFHYDQLGEAIKGIQESRGDMLKSVILPTA